MTFPFRGREVMYDGKPVESLKPRRVNIPVVRWESESANIPMNRADPALERLFFPTVTWESDSWWACSQGVLGLPAEID